MATKPKFKADTSFNFGANAPAARKKAGGKGKKARGRGGKGGGS